MTDIAELEYIAEANISGTDGESDQDIVYETIGDITDVTADNLEDKTDYIWTSDVLDD